MTALPNPPGIVQVHTASATGVRAPTPGARNFAQPHLHLLGGRTPYLLGQPTAGQADSSLRVYLSPRTSTIQTSVVGPCHAPPGCPCPRSAGVARLLLHPRIQTRDSTSARAAVRGIHHVHALQYCEVHLSLFTISGLTSDTRMLGIVVCFFLWHGSSQAHFRISTVAGYFSVFLIAGMSNATRLLGLVA